MGVLVLKPEYKMNTYNSGWIETHTTKWFQAWCLDAILHRIRYKMRMNENVTMKINEYIKIDENEKKNSSEDWPESTRDACCAGIAIETSPIESNAPLTTVWLTDGFNAFEFDFEGPRYLIGGVPLTEKKPKKIFQ